VKITKFLLRKFEEFGSDEQKLQSQPTARPSPLESFEAVYTLEEASMQPNYGGDGYCLHFFTGKGNTIHDLSFWC
jgi:hypothetical protein